MKKHKFKIGDIVRVISLATHDPYEIGDICEVMENDNIPFVERLSDRKRRCMYERQLELYEEKPEPIQKYKFKRGDIVKILKAEGDDRLSVGDICEVMEDDDIPFLKRLSDGVRWAMREEYLELYEESTAYKFKAGDKVRMLRREIYDYSGYPEEKWGMTGYIDKDFKDGSCIVYKEPNGKGRYYGFFDTSELEPVVEEPIDPTFYGGLARNTYITDEAIPDHTATLTVEKLQEAYKSIWEYKPLPEPRLTQEYPSFTYFETTPKDNLIKRKGVKKDMAVDIKVGDIYEVDDGEKCGSFRSRGKYIRITELSGDGSGIYYEILNADQKKVGSCCFCINPEDLKPVRKGIMGKVKTLARKLLDKDSQALIEAGVLNEDLSIRDTNFVLSFIVAGNKKALADEARAVLAEEKENT